MNNSRLVMDTVSLSMDEDNSEKQNEILRQREEELTKVISALEKIEQSAEWSSLKKHVFDGLKNSLEKDIFSEATKKQPSVETLSYLTGKWEWAKRFANLTSYRDEKRAELTSVRKSMHGKKE